MKKLTILALALCLAVVMAAPVMAVDADFSGAYRVRGSYVEHSDLRDTSSSNAFMNMRFRLQTVFKASDNLSVTTRFDALDNKNWGDSDNVTDTPATDGYNDIDFDRAYMTIKSGIGTFDIGRMAGGTFGTTFVDTEVEADRIKYTDVMGDLTLMAIFEKVSEGDMGNTAASDADSDKYVLVAVQKMENLTAGVMGTFTNDKEVAATTTRKYSLTPYLVGKFGPVNIQGEASYVWGTDDPDVGADVDYKALAYNLEASYDLGAASVMVGYAFISGNDENDATENTAFGGVGNDWEKLFILTTNEVTELTDLGGYGNLSNDGDSSAGAKIIYAGANFSPLENLALGVVVGNAKADEADAGYDDDYGTEYDLTLNWKIYDNLTYTAIAAFLDAGDFYKAGAAVPTFENTYALFHQLQLSF